MTQLSIKGIKTFMGTEGHGFNATLYVDGIKTAFVINSATGGSFDYQIINKSKFTEAEAYVKSLPKIRVDFGKDYPEHEMNTSLDILVSELIDNIEINKRLSTLMEKGILVGKPIKGKIPDGYEYRTYRFKVPLSRIERNHLQKCVNEVKSKLDNGDVIINTNLLKLGISV